jgi:hypothetical protein
MAPTRGSLTQREKTPKLALTAGERRALRAAKVTSNSIARLGGQELHRRLDGSVSRVRCDEIAALADFQRLSSIGPESARDFIALGLRSVAELKDQDPRELYARMCKITKARQDPCVEDAFRCAIAQARDPKLPAKMRDWWQWTSVRGRPISARPR